MEQTKQASCSKQTAVAAAPQLACVRGDTGCVTETTLAHLIAHHVQSEEPPVLLLEKCSVTLDEDAVGWQALRAVVSDIKFDN